MKTLSSSIVVLSGSVIIAGSGYATRNVETMSNMGLLVIVAGVIGWVYCLAKENNPPTT